MELLKGDTKGLSEGGEGKERNRMKGTETNREGTETGSSSERQARAREATIPGFSAAFLFPTSKSLGVGGAGFVVHLRCSMLIIRSLYLNTWPRWEVNLNTSLFKNERPRPKDPSGFVSFTLADPFLAWAQSDRQEKEQKNLRLQLHSPLPLTLHAVRSARDGEGGLYIRRGPSAGREDLGPGGAPGFESQLAGRPATVLTKACISSSV